MKRITNERKGITLISLVITIIILLILATVAISIAIDSNGLFARARKAAEDWNTSVADEERAIENVFEILNEVNVGGAVGGGEMQSPIVEVSSITLNPTALILTEGDSSQITATIEPPNATNQNIEWSSQSDTIVTVSKTGDGKKATVTAAKAGTTNIVAIVDGQTATCSVEVKPKGANEPAVPEGAKFQYVTWTDEDKDGTWDEHLSDTAPENWYNYEAKQWANIKTTSNNGSNEAYWVWIPRYAYQVPEIPTSSSDLNNALPFQIAFLQGNTNNPVNVADLGGATIRPASEIKDTVPNVGDWVVHPAFTFGEQELSGIWVAKYEANENSNVVNVKPNVTSWRSIKVSDIFTVCQAMNSTNGALEGAVNSDPHMMKNVEWGAVGYLAQSEYGKNGQVWINPNGEGSQKTGQAGRSPDSKQTTVTDNYNTGNGPQASTTGNVYGVYDMVGGSREYVAAYVDNVYAKNNGYSTNLINAADKYKDVYEERYWENYTKYGDAIYETNGYDLRDGNWQHVTDNPPYEDQPFFLRGGCWSGEGYIGLFCFEDETGRGYYSHTFRPVCIAE